MKYRKNHTRGGHNFLETSGHRPMMAASMKDSTQDSIALLIDADNAPAAKIDFIISELASHGVVNIRRAYGNWTKRGLSSWIDVLHGHAIQPMQSFDLVKGKNATDMSLLIDAMDILYTKDIQTFCLVSSDSDFTPLIQRLRADGKKVIGFGNQRTPEPFIASCTHFLYLDDTKAIKGAGKVEPKTATSTSNQLKGNSKLMTTLRSAVKAAADDDGWATLGPVGSHITNQGPFDHRSYGFKKLSDLFASIDVFEVSSEKTGNQTNYRVRLRKP
ncbi:MAG: NYN domain-containing protein [Akkermansiaceae bacterium]|nr:NYN domain-containing protein [Akkermansiaceae bacterium]